MFAYECLSEYIYLKFDINKIEIKIIENKYFHYNDMI